MSIRDSLLRAIVIFGVAALAITEALSLFQAIRPLPLTLAWTVCVAIGVFAARPRLLRFQIRSVTHDPVVVVCSLFMIAILAATAIAAAFSPPNSADAMAYHLPRVVYWAEQSSIRFFPTPYLNQIMLQPLAEYCMFHTYVLSGGDHLVNFVQWFGSLGSIIAVSAIAGLFGAGPRGQAIAALFCASLPAGILAASGAKNDYFLAMWIVIAVYFAGVFVRSQSWSSVLFMGLAAGLALLTKATAYLYLPWLLVAMLLPLVRSISRRGVLRLSSASVLALLISTPHYIRNIELSGSPLGFDSAQADGFFRWRNDTLGWRETASNVLRHASDQLGGRSEQWNRTVYNWTIRAHGAIGIDANDPRTTWRWTSFEPPRNANHEANANSKWHLLILATAGALLIRRGQLVVYLLAILAGFIAFCFYLKWQAFEARLCLPLMVAAAPIAGVAFETGLSALPSLLKASLQLALCFFLISNARRPALENWVRPLQGTRNVFHVPRDEQYFSDMSQWNNRATYERTVPLLAANKCSVIGIDSTNLSLEYPLMALVRERLPGARFLHTGVANASNKFPPPVNTAPCAVVCLNCASDKSRQKTYGSFPVRTSVDQFVVFQER